MPRGDGSKSAAAGSAAGWAILLVSVATLIAVIVFGVFIYNNTTSESSTLTGMQLLLSTMDGKLPLVTVLLDESPLTCKRRVLYEYGSSADVVHVYEKPDGVACEDVCYNTSLPRTCSKGKCVGTCLGTCSNASISLADSACPLVYVSNATVLAAAVLPTPQAIYFQQCMHGMCVYYIAFNTSLVAEMADGVVSATFGYSDGLVEDAQRFCMQFIGDQTPYKSCMVPALASLNNYNMNATSNVTNTSGSWGLCRYSFACAKPLEAGVDTGSTITFGLPSATSAALPQQNVGSSVLTRLFNYVQKLSTTSGVVVNSKSSNLIGYPPPGL